MRFVRALNAILPLTVVIGENLSYFIDITWYHIRKTCEDYSVPEFELVGHVLAFLRCNEMSGT